MPQRALRRMLGLVVALLLTATFATPAAAHDYLVSSTPEDGATLADAPTQVVLTFNASIGEQFAQVAVVDSAGTTYQSGPPVVDGGSLTQNVGDLPPGEQFTVSYRVVSSDGHPIGGTVGFAVAAAAPADQPAEPADQPAEPAEQPAEPAEQPADASADETAADQQPVAATSTGTTSTGTGANGLLIALGLLAFVGFLVLGLVVVRARARDSAGTR